MLRSDRADHATVVARIHVSDHVVNLRVQGPPAPCWRWCHRWSCLLHVTNRNTLADRCDTVVCWCRRQQIVGVGGDTYFARLSCGGDAGRRRWSRADLV